MGRPALVSAPTFVRDCLDRPTPARPEKYQEEIGETQLLLQHYTYRCITLTDACISILFPIIRWRGNDIVFSTEDCLVCALSVKSERRARPTRVDPLLWAFRTPTPLHGMRPHPQIQHGPFFAVSADMRVLQVRCVALPQCPSVVRCHGKFLLAGWKSYGVGPMETFRPE